MPIVASPKLLRRRRTKIVATFGPASAEPETIAGMIEAGVDVARLNMSHGDAASHRAVFGRLREAATAATSPLAVMADLRGPKIRVGRMAGGAIELADGAHVTLTPRDVVGEGGKVPVDYPRLCDEVEVGDRLLLDDGRLELVAESTGDAGVVCRVVHGGRLADRKGVNFPDTVLSVTALTDKDRADADLAFELGVDYLALSFVRRAAEVEQLRGWIEDAGSEARIVAKIEKPEALRNIDDILGAADAIMVARGDLGVEMAPEAVPAAQDELVALARARRKPVIIATQMLESMMRDPRPTRAEVSDVAHAVRSGTDAVMLSGETAIGEYPVAAVTMMDRIVRRTEAEQWADSAFRDLTKDDTASSPTINEAVGAAVSQLSRDLRVRAILVISRSGTSGMEASSCRPAAPLLAATPSARTRRAMNLFWGVVPMLVDEERMEDPVTLLRALVADLELAQAGQTGLIVRGFRVEDGENQPTITALRL